MSNEKPTFISIRISTRKKLRELGKNAFIGDIISPIDEEWEAMK